MEIKEFDPMHRWFDLCHRNNVDVRAATQMCQQLIDSYNDSQRHYHTMSHIHECLNLLDTFSLKQNERDTVEYAVWFHDIIYDPASDSNEKQSATIAKTWLTKHGIKTTDDVVTLILQTAHYDKDPPIGHIESILHDLDLHVLGSPAHKYLDYATKIRNEYQHLDNDAFFAGRRKFLQSLLSREGIYATTGFQELFEEQAIRNIKTELSNIEKF
ncbi:MAG: hypothetical protein CL455_06745 [Acidimicrobiaceae bacterium]|nr:hypothetical protein [Acidimicrobiaceae bacterium]